ncbi:MAG: CBS domain-containing protein [Limisphaerales bacterium]
MKILTPISSLLHQKGSVVWHVSPDASVFDAIKVMAGEKNIGALPVISRGALVGIFTERDYTRKIALMAKPRKTHTSGKSCPAKSSVSLRVMTLKNVCGLMTQHRIRHLPVVEDGKLLGIVSIGDLVNWIISAQNSTIEQMEQYIAGGVPA